MSEVNIQNMVAAIAATDLLVPLEIVQAAQQLERWFTEQNITEWELGDCASRITVLHLRKSLSNLVEQRYATLRLAKELHQQKAHTYASENADLYRGFDNGCKYAANRINKIFSPKDGSEKQAHDKRDKQI